MDLNLLPEEARSAGTGPSVGLSLEGVRREDVLPRLCVTSGEGFAAVELPVTGEPWGLYAPSITGDERTALHDACTGFRRMALLAPSQGTFDVTLVSPSAAIRRASVSELWSVCKLAGALRRGPEAPPATVIVRTGITPSGVSSARENAAISECLVTLDRMAGEQGAEVALLNADFFHDLRRVPSLRSLSLKHTGAALDAGMALDSGQSGDDLAEFALNIGGMLRYVRVPDSILSNLEPLASALSGAEYEGMVCIVPSSPAPDPDRLALVRAWWSSALGLSADAGDEVAG